MSKRIQYEIVTDKEVYLGTGRFGSSKPFAAAVLTTAKFTDEHGVCTVRWTVSRCSYTMLAAQTYCDQLRSRGYNSVVVPMRPVVR